MTAGRCLTRHHAAAHGGNRLAVLSIGSSVLVVEWECQAQLRALEQSLVAIMEFIAHEIPNLPAMNAGALTEIALGVAYATGVACLFRLMA